MKCSNYVMQIHLLLPPFQLNNALHVTFSGTAKDIPRLKQWEKDY